MKLKRITVLLIFLVLVNLLSGNYFCVNTLSGPVIMSLNVCSSENMENVVMDFIPESPVEINFLSDIFSKTLFIKMAFYRYIPSSLLDRPPCIDIPAEGSPKNHQIFWA